MNEIVTTSSAQSLRKPRPMPAKLSAHATSCACPGCHWRRVKDTLGMMVDLSIKFRPKRVTGTRFSSTDTSEAYCVFCGDNGPTPPEVRHKHNCIVAKAKDLLKV